jgi:predicted nucleotide-binding protein (sugar kinase/HSP70/actin superfamily)
MSKLTINQGPGNLFEQELISHDIFVTLINNALDTIFRPRLTSHKINKMRDERQIQYCPQSRNLTPTVNTTGKKFPNKLRNPKVSKQIPTIPQRISTSIIPSIKHAVPRHLSFLQK